MTSPLLIALPSKGRLKEQAEAWLAECGFQLDMLGGARGYRAALKAEGLPADRLRFATAFGRAFGYYDGFLFEVRSAALDAERPVAAVGRYDGLLARLGARRPLGAVGCMVRPWRAFKRGEPS